MEKVKEEFVELDHEVNQENNSTKIEKEFGDVLFSLINYARFIGVDPESALERTNKKFISRFSFLENEIKEKGLKFESMNLQEMDEIWNKSKKCILNFIFLNLCKLFSQ